MRKITLQETPRMVWSDIVRTVTMVGQRETPQPFPERMDNFDQLKLTSKSVTAQSGLTLQAEYRGVGCVLHVLTKLVYTNFNFISPTTCRSIVFPLVSKGPTTQLLRAKSHTCAPPWPVFL